MDLIADILLIAGTVAAVAYCIVLSRRLRRFTDLEKGVGGAIAALSAQVDGMTTALRTAQTSAVDSAQSLHSITSNAQGVARRLELLVASMHDIPESVPAANISEQIPDETAPEEESAPLEKEPLFLSQRRPAQEAAE